MACLWLVLAYMGLAFGAATQEQPPPAQKNESVRPSDDPAPTSDAETPGPSLTVTELQLLLKQAQDSPDLAEEVKTRVVALYTQAVQQVEIAEQWAAKAAAFEAERQAAPETLKGIQAELAASPAEPTPDVAPDATRADMEARLRQVQIDLEAEKKALADWERERERRATRRRDQIPESLAAAKALLQKLGEAPTPPEADQAPAMRRAQTALTQAKRLAVEREIEAYNAELLSYDARRELLQARLDRATRRVAHFEKLAGAWQKLVQARAQRESEQALREAREQLKRAHPAIKPLAEEREQLALRVKALQAEIKQVDTRMAEVDTRLTRLAEDFKRVTDRIKATGLTNAIGQLLRRHRANLPSLRPLERNIRQRKDRLNEVELARLELQDRRSELLSVDAIVSDVAASIDPAASETDRDSIRQAAEEAAVALLADTDTALKEYDGVFDKLIDLDSKERALIASIRSWQDYVDEKILWIESGTLPTSADVNHAREALAWLLDPARWKTVFVSTAGTFRANPAPTTIGALALLAAWLLTGKLRRIIRASAETVGRPTKDNMRLTIGVLAATTGMAAVGPATLWFLAWVVAAPYDATDFSKAVASGFSAAAFILLTLEFLRRMFMREGLAEKHFRWNARALTVLRRHVWWLMLVLVPTAFVFAALEARGVEAARSSLGRLAFVVSLLSIGFFGQRVMRPAGPVLAPVFIRRGGGWLYRTRYVWYVLSMLLPLALVVGAIVGYYYTALYLCSRLVESVWLLLGLMILRALVERWLLIHMRRRAIAEARERAAARRQQMEAEAGAPTEQEAAITAAEKLDVAAINYQTLKLVGVTQLIVGAFVLWGIWSAAMPALGVFRTVTAYTVTHQASQTVSTAEGGTEVNEFTEVVPITLAHLGVAILVTLVTVVAVMNIPGLLEVTVLQRLPMDAGGRFAATTITRYIITVMGTVIAFGQLGLGWSKVQWLVAAMTVGLGFGLQEIFANFVCGLIILFERPIRLGDIVTVGTIEGTVTRIRIRATTITDWDRRELIVPNKDFITGQLVNWTLSDSITRVVIPVGVAYGSDTQRARDLLIEAAVECIYVSEDPPPSAIFRGFGDSALDFQLRVFIPTRDRWPDLMHELHTAIDQKFRKAGIEIAFPQRDIHIRSIKGPVPFAREGTEVEIRQEA